MQETIDEAVPVDPEHLCIIALAISRNIKWDLMNIEDSSTGLYREVAKFAEVAAQTFTELVDLGNQVPLDAYITNVVEPFGITISQQMVMGTYSYVECLIQLGKDTFTFLDTVEECTDEELAVISEYTEFSLKVHHTHQLKAKNALLNVTLH